MDDVIALTYACEAVAKNVHYGSRGPSFYGIHTMVDKVDFGDDRDELIEVAYLGSGKGAPATESLYAKAVEMVNAQEAQEPLHELSDILLALVYAVEEAKRVERPLAGVHAVLDGISQKALVVRGLVLRTIAES